LLKGGRSDSIRRLVPRIPLFVCFFPAEQAGKRGYLPERRHFDEGRGEIFGRMCFFSYELLSNLKSMCVNLLALKERGKETSYLGRFVS
jgi:hypothetical protein